MNNTLDLDLVQSGESESETYLTNIQLNTSRCDVCRLSSSILLINYRYDLDHLVYSLNCFWSVTILNTTIKSSI